MANTNDLAVPVLERECRILRAEVARLEGELKKPQQSLSWHAKVLRELQTKNDLLARLLDAAAATRAVLRAVAELRHSATSALDHNVAVERMARAIDATPPERGGEVEGMNICECDDQVRCEACVIDDLRAEVELARPVLRAVALWDRGDIDTVDMGRRLLDAIDAIPPEEVEKWKVEE